MISNGQALAETLASELGDISVTGTTVNDAGNYLHKEDYDLIIIDNDTNYQFDITQENIIKLIRPIRLSDAIYTIFQKLKSKTAQGKEEIALCLDCLFSINERVIRSIDNTVRIPLTEKEAELLQHLMQDNETELSRELLLKNIWGYNDDINTHTLETHIYRLRNKLKQASEYLDIIFSAEGHYRLR